MTALGAVQAQDFDGAKWAIALRSSVTDVDIERAFTAGTILRTHVLRPTWHFVDPVDIRWMLRLSAPRVMTIMSSYDRVLGLDAKVYRRSNAVIARALRDHNYLTRTELKEALGRAKMGPLPGARLARLVMRAELDAVICSGPRRGKQFTYALLDERAPSVPARDRDEDLQDLTLRYFRGRSPATAHDFAWWSGLAMRDVKRGIEVAGAQLMEQRLGDVRYWRLGDPPPAPPPSAHFLPNYDEYFIGFRDRSAIGRRLGTVTAVTGGSALIAHVLIVDGQLVGGWKRRTIGDHVTMQAFVLTRLSAAERKRLIDAARSFERFLDRKVKVTWERRARATK